MLQSTMYINIFVGTALYHIYPNDLPIHNTHFLPVKCELFHTQLLIYYCRMMFRNIIPYFHSNMSMKWGCIFCKSFYINQYRFVLVLINFIMLIRLLLFINFKLTIYSMTAFIFHFLPNSTHYI